MTENLKRVEVALRTILPEHCIISGSKVTEPFTADTSSNTYEISLIVRPDNKEQIQQLVALANTIKLPLYPISTGNNWGYGTSQPPQPGCVLVLLDRLKRIELDGDLNLLTIEPGVTQADLYNYFLSRGLEYMVPTTPSVSG